MVMKVARVDKALKCDNNTSKEEIFDFLQNNMDREIEILYVAPVYNHWSNWKHLEILNNHFNSEKIKIIVDKYKVLSVFVYEK